jgi:hypothetical protein
MSSDRRPEETRAPLAPEGERPRWLDDRGNVDKLVQALYAVCAVLLLIDPLVHKHGPFEIEHWWGFYAIYGFVGCVFLVLAAKVLRMIVMRPEDYYDR